MGVYMKNRIALNYFDKKPGKKKKKRKSSNIALLDMRGCVAVERLNNNPPQSYTTVYLRLIHEM